MSFESAMSEAAHAAADIANRVMSDLATGYVKHEDDLSGVLVGALREGFRSLRTEDIVWNASILTHRRSGEEGKYGADLLLHIELDTPDQQYSKGVLVQSKRIGPHNLISAQGHSDLKAQCDKMLGYTSEAFVFAYDPNGMRCGSANRVVGASGRNIYNQCSWTAYRFFLEFFRCPTGDRRITSARVEDLEPRHALQLTGKGDFKLIRKRDLLD